MRRTLGSRAEPLANGSSRAVSASSPISQEPPTGDVQPAAPSAEEKQSARKLDAWLTSPPGVAAILSSVGFLLFIVLDSSYIYYYEHLGVKPEDVGFDRIAILARTAALLPITFVCAYLVYLLIITLRIHKWSWGVWAAASMPMGIATLIIDSTWMSAAFEVFAGLGFASLAVKYLQKFRVALALFAAALLFFAMAGLDALQVKTSERIHAAETGHAVTPVSWLGLGESLPVADLYASPATARWLDASTKPPTLLDDPYLLYLGHGRTDRYFVACGSTLAIPESKVAVAQVTGAVRHDEKSDAERLKFCESVRK